MGKFDMKRWVQSLVVVLLIGIASLGVIVPNAWAFCGFYVAKADTKLYNKASQVVIAREGNRTILTMANDYQGEAKDFAIVVPVPVVLKAEQVQIGESVVIQHLDAFSAPRLVEYFDPDPCEVDKQRRMPMLPSASAPAAESSADRRARAQGVTIESRFSVGEYDILILSAKESSGLQRWLQQNGYRIPKGAVPLLQPYVRQNMKFFVAKVNLEKFQKSGFQLLRPLQIAFASPKFMLPIRLGMVNATTDQDLLVYILSPKGRAEVINYRTVKVPSDAEIPVFVKQEFGDFYKAMFQQAYLKQGRNVAFLEYAWNMSNCDPCSAEPLSPDELRKAGVFWLDDAASIDRRFPNSTTVPPRRPLPSGNNVFLTRLHVRYARDKFPEDLMFQQTSNQENFQGRYVLRHPYKGEINCPAGRQYQRSLRQRFDREAQTLAQLTGWKLPEIRQKIKLPETTGNEPFWRSIWPQ
jgi:hypothetical protein